MSVAAGNNSINTQPPSARGLALVVDDNVSARAELENHLVDRGFDLLISGSGSDACELFGKNKIDIVFISALLRDMDCSEIVRHIKEKSTEVNVPVVVLAPASNDAGLRDCMRAGADDFLGCRYTTTELDTRIRVMEQLRELKCLYKNSIHEQEVARQILSVALLARSTDIEGLQVFTRSAAIFSGDLVLSARNPDGGLYILLADFTGHGLSAAICVLPVADMFSVMTEKGFSPDIIIKNINEKLCTLLPTGMFMAACMVAIDSNLYRASVLNSGMPDVYLLGDQTGQIKRRVRSTHIPLGITHSIDGRLKFEEFDIEPGDCFILYSDGLADAIDSSGNMFGEKRLESVIEQHTDRRVFEAIVGEFDQFCSNQELSDDVTLVTFQCDENLHRIPAGDGTLNLRLADSGKDRWRFLVEVSGASLRDINPVSLILDHYRNLDDAPVSVDRLHTILSALYANALDHGVLELSHLVDLPSDDKELFEQERAKRLGNIRYGFVRIELQHILYQGSAALLLRLEDSGRGFDHVGLLADIDARLRDESDIGESGIPMVRGLCQALVFYGRGNRVEVILNEKDYQGGGS